MPSFCSPSGGTGGTGGGGTGGGGTGGGGTGGGGTGGDGTGGSSCGDGTIGPGEECDSGSSSTPQSCAGVTNPATGQPFTGGTLSCDVDCLLDTSGCF
jgi:hypothetical protein